MLVALATACGSSHGVDSSASRATACKLFTQLDHIATDVGHSDVADPEHFHQSIDAAAERYAKTVRELRPVVPDTLHPALDRLEAAIEQYRWTDAATARRSLDAYATRSCGTASSSG